MTSSHEAPGLARIRRRRLSFLATLLVLPLLLVALPALELSTLSSQRLLLAWCALYSLTTVVCVFSRCPRCGHLFHSVYAAHNPFSRSCRGCGLSLEAHL